MRSMILGAILVAAALLPTADAVADPFQRDRSWSEPRGAFHGYHVRQTARHPGWSHVSERRYRSQSGSWPQVRRRVVRQFERNGDRYRVVKKVRRNGDDARVIRKVYRNGELQRRVKRTYRDGELSRTVRQRYRDGEKARSVRTRYRNGEPTRSVRTRYRDGRPVRSVRTRYRNGEPVRTIRTRRDGNRFTAQERRAFRNDRVRY